MRRRNFLAAIGCSTALSGCLDNGLLGGEDIYENSSNEVVWGEDTDEELEPGEQVIVQIVEHINEGDEEAAQELVHEGANFDLRDRDDAIFGESEHWLAINKLEFANQSDETRSYVAEFERGTERRRMGLNFRIKQELEDDFGEIDLDNLPSGYDVDDPEIWRLIMYDNWGEPE